jgi:hypothetical protein
MPPPSSYFGAGDEPFNGLFENGDPVAAAFDGLDGQIAGAGTARAEVSQFLVDANANGDPREQLAQQLLAFVFNTRHRLDSAGASIQMPDGSFRAAQSLIDDAITAWSSGSAADRTAMSQLLDGFNNDDSVSFVHYDPCAVTY